MRSLFGLKHMIMFSAVLLSIGSVSAQQAFAGVSEFDVSISKDCDALVIQVPDNPADKIDCSIYVLNTGEKPLTNCDVTDSLSGFLAVGEDLLPGGDIEIFTHTTVTAQMIIDMTFVNTANVECNEATDSDFASIEVRSVDGGVSKTCIPDAQFEPGSIQWDWEVENTSPDGKSSLGVSCDGVSTLNDPEVNDNLVHDLSFGSQAANMWTEFGLAAGTYENEITCTFTAQDDRSFQRMASDSCEVTPFEPEIECTIEPASANVEISEKDGSGFVEKKITCDGQIVMVLGVFDNTCINYDVSFQNEEVTDNMVEFVEQVTNSGPLEPEICEVEWGVDTLFEGLKLVTQELRINMPEDKLIGGTVGSMSTTSLLVAGAQANMGLWSLALVGIVGAAAAITYKVKSKKTEQ